MSWNMSCECVSAVVLCIIWIYSRKGNPTPSTKNRLFQICFLTTFCAMTSNILSAFMIFHLTPALFIPTWIITMIYYICTPLMGLIYFYYVLVNTYGDGGQFKKIVFISSIPSAIYVIFVLLNPINNDLFNITLANGYTQGPLVSITYIIFYLYCLVSLFLVIAYGKNVDSSTRGVLFVFPLMAAGVIIIQLYVPTIVLTGSAATCSLLLIYLFMQNKQISIDYLTKLPLRHELLKMMELLIRKKRHFTVIVISLRGFKSINDSFGQEGGDNLLISVTKYLKRNFKMSESEIYRYNGDEFAILLSDKHIPMTEHIIADIIQRMTEPWKTKKTTATLAASIGVVSYPDVADNMKDLLSALEYSVSVAKTEQSYHNICHCTPLMLEKTRRNQTIADILHECIDQGGFEIHYQPIYAVESKTFSTAEALLRIPNSRLGPLSPGEFIPIAEKSGLIVEITYLVLEKVSGYISELIKKGIYIDNINVNFPSVQFAQHDLIDRMQEIINRNNIPTNKINVELTESTLMENPTIVTQSIHRMHSMGIHIGLDDFGTGYSNLTSVISLPLDRIKLDKSLVWSSMISKRFASVVYSLTQGFLSLGVNVLAEGVENNEHDKFVKDCGCGYIQGFLYAKPMPPKEFEEFMKANAKN